MYKKLCSIILLLPFRLLAIADPYEGIYAKATQFFEKDEFEAGIIYLDEKFNEKKKTERYYRYKSFLSSFFIKQAWEQDRGVVFLIKLVSTVKDHNKAYVKAFPECGSGYVGIGEHYQYAPVILGGGEKKAEKQFKKALQKKHTVYDLYKILLFYMNEKKDYLKAQELLPLFKEPSINDPYFSNYINVWLKYQKGVIAFNLGHLEKAKGYLSSYMDNDPDSHWAAYIFYQVTTAENKPQVHYLNKSYQIASEKGNRAFIKQLRKENPNLLPD